MIMCCIVAHQTQLAAADAMVLVSKTLKRGRAISSLLGKRRTCRSGPCASHLKRLAKTCEKCELGNHLSGFSAVVSLRRRDSWRATHMCGREEPPRCCAQAEILKGEWLFVLAAIVLDPRCCRSVPSKHCLIPGYYGVWGGNRLLGGANGLAELLYGLEHKGSYSYALCLLVQQLGVVGCGGSNKAPVT